MLGFLFALYLVLQFGCTPTFTQSRETCLGKVDSPKEAAALVVPHLAAAMVCASQNIEDDAAAIACVEREFVALKAEVTPVVYACALTLLGDAVTAGRK